METNTRMMFIPESKIGEDRFGVEYDVNNQRLLTAFRLSNHPVKQYEVKAGTKIISDGAFDSLVELESIGLPDSVEIIESRAFFHCASLKRIHLPASLHQIGAYAFCSCTNIEEISIDEQNVHFKVEDGFILSKDGSTLIYAIPGQTSDCVNIPKGVVEISEGAFLRNKLLRRVNLPDTLKTIGKFAFEECLQLETINLPEGLTSLEDGCFYHSTIQEITIPASVISIGVGAFSACYALDRINVNEENPYFVCINGVLLTANRLTLLNYPSASKEKVYSVPLSILTINPGAFESCLYLERIILHDGLVSIGNDTFSNCRLLNQITLPKTIRWIGDRAFYGCSMLDNITLPPALSFLGRGAFGMCQNLKKINIPEHLNSIGDDAIQFNENLEISVHRKNSRYRVFNKMIYEISNCMYDYPLTDDFERPF
jgi:hypothetical protein